MKKWHLMLFVPLICSIGFSVTFVEAQDTKGKPKWYFQLGKDYSGAPLQAALDANTDVSYFATSARIYEVREGKARQIAHSPDESSRVTLAAGGGVYAVMTQKPGWKGLFSVNIYNMSGTPVCELKRKEFPHGFGSLYLGFKGKLIATATPLDDWQGLSGRFDIVFWNLKGEAVQSVVLDGLQTGVMDAFGEAILFLGEKEARAFSESGKELWKLKGSYRKAALSSAGRLALLNPSATKNIKQVLMFKGKGEPASLTVPTPVHGLEVVPDGSSGIIVGDRGRYFRLDPAKGEMKEGKRLPLKSNYYIFHTALIDKYTVAFGLLERTGKAPDERWTKGDIIVVDKKDTVLFRKEFPVQQAISLYPTVFTTFGSYRVIGLTEDSATLIELGK